MAFSVNLYINEKSKPWLPCHMLDRNSVLLFISAFCSGGLSFLIELVLYPVSRNACHDPLK